MLNWLKLGKKRPSNEQLKNEFVTVVTHKFRTPITRIKWATSMLHDNVTFQNKEDLLKDIEQSAQQIIEIVDLLTEFTSLATKPVKEYEAIPLRQLIASAIGNNAALTREKKITFDLRINDDVPALKIEKNKIQFVINVLVENALKYTPAGGTIVIGLLRDNQDVILSVSDTGIGVSPENIESIFQGFWRSEEATRIDTEGMGLSLHTARAIIENQGGQMWAESAGSGKGTSFFVRLKIRGYDFKIR